MARESIETLCNKARRAVAQGDNDQARQLYLQALGLKKDAPDVHYGLATVYFLMGDLASAATANPVMRAHVDIVDHQTISGWRLEKPDSRSCHQEILSSPSFQHR